MRKLLTALFIIAFIASCSSPSGPDQDSFKPYRIGTWLITSPTHAKYAGEQKHKQSTILSVADTIDISQPGQYSAQLISIPESKHQVYFDFVDKSGLQPQDFPDMIKITMIGKLTDKYGDYAPRIRASRSSTKMNSDSLFIRSNIQYICADVAGEIKQIRITFYKDKNDSTSHYRQYRIHTKGFIEAIKSLTAPCPD